MMYLTSIHGKTNLKIKLLEESDTDKLAVFCDRCDSLGFVNNKDFKAIKLDKMQMPYGQFFIAVDTDNDSIFSIAGVHHFPEVNNNSYRVLFRGAQLPGYNQFSTDFYHSVIHFGYFLYYQIRLITDIHPEAEFYITTNVNEGGSKSHNMDRVMMPIVRKRGICELTQSNVMIYNTPQNVWKVNVDEYMRQRETLSRYNVSV